MGLLGIIISVIFGGLIVGALGRLAIPGPNPMSIGMTIAVGIGGSLIGAIIGGILLRDDSPGIIVFEVLAAAGIVYFMQRRDNRSVT
jgi:uncharacterized membrane protein YeaQ/YmgE (transglycosylase-associated protein family)